MKRLLFLTGLVGALLIASGPSYGADGDSCLSIADASLNFGFKGDMVATACYMLCDGPATGTSSCTEWDFRTSPGMPDVIVFEYQQKAVVSCAATPDITLTTGPLTGGTPGYDLDTSAVVLNSTTDRVVIDTRLAPMDRFLFATIADNTDCAAGDMDVRMTFYSQKSGMF